MNDMNKCSILFAIAILSWNTAIAGNLYGGLNLGINSVKIDKSLVYPIGNPPLTSFNYNPGYNNFHGQLFIGDDFTLTEHVNLALQGDADLFTGSTQNTINNWFLTTNARVKEKLKYGFGVFLLPEYQFDERFRVFVGPGFVSSKFSTSSGVTAGNLGVTGDVNRWLSGWAVKLGTANKIAPHWDFLLTYQYDQYSSFTRTSIEPLTGQALQATYKPRANLFSVGVRYLMDDHEPIHYEK